MKFQSPSRPPISFLAHRLLKSTRKASVAFGSLFLLPVSTFGAGSPGKPNIVLILADDLGYGDVSAYNPASKIQTPNLDKLAGAGIRFSDAHAPSSVCTPTRYAILTGRYAWRSPLKGGVLPPWGAPLIDAGRPTLPGLLKQQGYRTAAIGKWHLGWTWPTRDGAPPSGGVDRLSNVDFTKPITDGPTARGFDHYFGVDVPNYPPYVYIENDHTVGIPSQPSGEPYNRPGPVLPGWDWTDILPEITRRSVSYIDDATHREEPYFLYLPLTSPHYPIVPTAEFRGKSGAGDYGDFVLQTDWTVGRILDAIDRSGQADNTLVIFTSDNGPEVTGEVKPGVYDRLQQYGHSSAGDLRGAKRDLWEGGHRVPFIVRWPARIKAGLTSAETISHVDLFATTAAITGGVLAPDAAPDSFNILPALVGEKMEGTLRPATIHHGLKGSLAIREGDWVFIDAPSGGANREPEWRKEQWEIQPHAEQAELFNLAGDPKQQRNVIVANREKAREMKQQLDRIVSEGRSTPGPALKNDPPTTATNTPARNSNKEGPWKSGDVLTPEDSPAVAGRSFTITARITPQQPQQGVILAQGGARHGYALYLEDGRIIFAIRTDGKLTTTSVPMTQVDGSIGIEASLTESGLLRLRVNDGDSVTAQAPGALAKQPGDPLGIGSDVQSPVGVYVAPNEFHGSIEEVRIHVGDAK